MEFNFNIRPLLAYGVSVVDKRLLPHKSKQTPESFNHRSQLMTVIDKMGAASAQAQGLYGPITSSRKLELSNHHLYIIKDGEAGSVDAVIGILKVGHKKLFVYDNNGAQREMDPLCVLDFYVHESRQRQGCGKRLFEFMLQSENVQPHHLAIDKPSHKFSSFLKKHYHLNSIIPQVNNFVVFEGFFSSRPDSTAKRANGMPPDYPLNRANSLHREASTTPLRQLQSGGYASRPPSGKRPWSSRKEINMRQVEKEKDALKSINLSNGPQSGESWGVREADNQSPVQLDLRGLAFNNHQAHTAGANLYSRHYVNRTPPAPRPSSGSQYADGNRSRPGSATKTSDGIHKGPQTLQPNGSTEHRTNEISYNLHQEYQGHKGHLKVTPGVSSLPDINSQLKPKPTGSLPPVRPLPGNSPNKSSPYSEQSVRARTMDTSWTVFGVPPGYRGIAERKYAQTRLW